MDLAAAFDPTIATSGSFTASTLQTGSTMIVRNKTYVDVIFQFANGDERLVIANESRAWVFGDASVVANGMIKWKQENIDYPQTINQLQNICYVEIYAPTEKVVESYPQGIQRETLPTLIPYNIGTSIVSTGTLTPNNATHTIFPSSYNGVTCCPQSVGGMGFDHFYLFSFLNSTTLIDLAGSYPATGKVANTGTLQNLSAATIIPGPFSKAGLSPLDSATYLNSTYWSLASNINWPASFYLDCWVNVGALNAFTWVLGDNVLGIGLSPDGTSFISLNTTGSGTIFVNNPVPLALDTWYHLAIYVTANTASYYINGTLINTKAFSGTVVPTTEVLGIGGQGPGGFSTITGSIANIGILLSDIALTRWGVNAVLARYLLGQQSYSIDMQSVWLTGFDLYTLSGPSTNYQYSLSNVINPAGLLFAQVRSQTDPLHIIPPFSTFIDFMVPQQTAPYFYTYRPPNPITHSSSGFLNFNDWVSTGPKYTMNIYGYNILGFV